MMEIYFLNEVLIMIFLNYHLLLNWGDTIFIILPKMILALCTVNLVQIFTYSVCRLQLNFLYPLNSLLVLNVLTFWIFHSRRLKSFQLSKLLDSQYIRIWLLDKVWVTCSSTNLDWEFQLFGSRFQLLKIVNFFLHTKWLRLCT